VSATASRAPTVNKLLAALPRTAYQRVFAELTPVELKTGEVLYEAGRTIRYVYFPIDCVLCLLTQDEAQKPVDVGLIGREGMLGVSFALGATDSILRAAVRSSGTALRMDAARYQKEFLRSLSWQRELFRYTNSQLALVRQAVACHCFHRAEARVACSLLMASDRVGADEFQQDQDSMAGSLGLTRSTVSMCAGHLRERKLISYARGKIRILDRKQLEAAACECYEYAKMLDALSDRVTQCQRGDSNGRVRKSR
jgi:CRP-like cAMP-binding protein